MQLVSDHNKHHGMDETLTIAEIADSIGVTTNHVRYVLDSRILPGRRHGTVKGSITPGRGVTRRLPRFSAFGVAIAVLLLDAGIRRDFVRKLLDVLVAYAPGTREISSTLIHQAYSNVRVTTLEIGDSTNVRMIDHSNGGQREDEWIQVATGAKVVGYEPRVTVAINLTRLRRELKA